jgi:hypothetical protein
VRFVVNGVVLLALLLVGVAIFGVGKQIGRDRCPLFRTLSAIAAMQATLRYRPYPK